MSSNEERRDAARRKLEERLENERRAARQRKLALISVCSVAVLAAVAVGGYFYYRHWDDERHTTCEYTAAPADWDKRFAAYEAQIQALPADQQEKPRQYLAELKEGAKKARTSPMPESRTLNTGNLDWTLDTSQGKVPITLDRSSAPCNVNAVVTLSNNKYYDGTDCFLMVATGQVNLLQCGDPTSTGSGDPGWTSPDEEPMDLKPAEGAQTTTGASAVVYPKGTVAIFNENQQNPEGNTGSAQFLIVTKDSQLPASFAVIGSVTDEGMKVIDKVAAGGIDPGVVGNAQSGKPKTGLTITSASVSED